ncbi:hypothetical protein ABWH93_15105 [Seohaeicola saemankumensis]|uniref:hypothetical protein n=1 Tax=Seohaeicola TaxID=481178 RepID=UPI0035CFF3FB
MGAIFTAGQYHEQIAGNLRAQRAGAIATETACMEKARVGSAFAYSREDRNTDWIRADTNGRLTGDDALAEVLSTIAQKDFIRGAFIALKQGESMDAGLERGQTMKLFSSRHDLHLDTAFL